MWDFFNSTLMSFRESFRREATFQWFAVIVVGLMVRTDCLGVTSVIRGLLLTANYMGIIRFFRSAAWTLEGLSAKWYGLVNEYAPLLRQNGRVILVGDGVKQAKEGRRMPGVKRQHQASENTAKAPYMFGHLFGGLGVLAARDGKQFCVPLVLRIQDGVKTIFGWGEKPERQASHVVEIVRLAREAAGTFGNAVLLLDSYFLTVPALTALDETGSGGLLHIVTKAKSNCVAYHSPGAKTGRRGRPRRKGAAVHVAELFESARRNFISAEFPLYGKTQRVLYHSADLLWGPKLYMKLRFVLVEMGGTRAILVSTDLTLEPADIILLYGKRFGIECMFREMKQVLCAFGYRFWSKSMPKLNRFRKKSEPDPLQEVIRSRDRKRISQTVKAIEGFVFCCIVATGLMQISALRFSGTGELAELRFLRTRRQTVPSEATVADFLRKNIFWFLLFRPDLPLTQIISQKQADTQLFNRFHRTA